MVKKYFGGIISNATFAPPKPGEIPVAEYQKTPIRGVAQPGSAHVWGAWGRKFKSCRPDESGKSPAANSCRIFLFCPAGRAILFLSKKSIQKTRKKIIYRCVSIRPRALIPPNKSGVVNEIFLHQERGLNALNFSFFKGEKFIIKSALPGNFYPCLSA